MKNTLVLLCLLLAPVASSRGVRRYVVLHTDESKLVLRDAYEQSVHVVEAVTYCWEHRGFTSGATLLSADNLSACGGRTTLIAPTDETCDVWCP